MEELLSGAATALTQGPSSLTGIAGKPSLQRSLNAIRTHLDMDVAFISEFADGRRFFRHVDARESKSIVQPGNSDPLEESYCLRVVTAGFPNS